MREEKNCEKKCGEKKDSSLQCKRLCKKKGKYESLGYLS